MVSLVAALAVALPAVILPGAADARAMPSYGHGEICRDGRVLRCLSYPRRIGYHRANCRWVRTTLRGASRSFEICRDPRGVWRPSGRG